MRWRSAISPTGCAAARRSCSPGRGRNGNCRAPNGWNCSSFWPSAASIAAPPTASSAARPGRRCVVTRPRSEPRRTGLPPPTCWSGCAGGEPGIRSRKVTVNGRFPRLFAGKSARRRPDSATMTSRTTIVAERMPKPKSFLRLFTEPGPLTALAVAIALLIGIASPASAQFFNFGGWSRPQPRSGGGGWFGGDLFAPFQQQPAPKKAESFSKAPPPEKRETVPERNVLVLGDAMADWLAYGLEDAYAEQPDMGVIRRHKTVSGLIKYQPKGDPADWAAAAKGILATEKADAIVVMLGLNDRVQMREQAGDKADVRATDKKKDARAKPDARPADAKPADAKPDDKAVDAELSPDDSADNSDAPPSTGPEKSARAPNGLIEFRDERWIELYRKK